MHKQAYTKNSRNSVSLQALLVNNGTASTSEMPPASLRDNPHARLIGEHSYGKGRTQRILNMRDGSTLLVSTSLVTTPTFRRIDKVDLPHQRTFASLCEGPQEPKFR